ncbi:SDR family oxidoreductase [Solimonas terrae]|uniref:SDR family NAD(P)-dependent oxidoreductase n=1 Tax=Solimonas terrae TaxID=1396819 RepID=A0A6M2BML7_9GAMM|nr:SDR family NAD(P)-dependent oxidoreductase [Solimonas terrae]NGY03339.1 SDR family NAD(P)-dependent oxidoreductase [Solimonas terrae]
MTDVQGRTAFITGGGNGIGLGIARVFARAGVKLALADLDEAALARAKAELQDITAVETYRLDVRDREAYAETAEAVEGALGPVSLLFNNAGVAGSVPLSKLSYELWDFNLGINLQGVINGIQTFLPRMLKQGLGGHVVNTSSGAGLAVTASGLLYTTAKFAVVGLSESLRQELVKTDIGCSVLCPGMVATNIVQRSADASPKPAGAMTKEAEQAVADRVKMVGQALLQQGVGIDTVGELVLKGVQENRMYIHTDAMMRSLVKARSQALLESFPS